MTPTVPDGVGGSASIHIAGRVVGWRSALSAWGEVAKPAAAMQSRKRAFIAGNLPAVPAVARNLREGPFATP